MTLYENHSDRKNQSEVAAALHEHLQALPIGRVEVIETPQSRALSHDLEIWVNGLFVGVGEIKCRNYDTRFFADNGFVITQALLQHMKRSFYLPKHGWTKDVSLIFRTSDNDIFLISMEKLIMNWDQITEAPQSVMKDDHGTKPRSDPGVIIPMELMTCIT